MHNRLYRLMKSTLLGPRGGEQARDAAHRLNLNRLIVQTSNAIEQVLGPQIYLSDRCDQDLPPVSAVNNM